MSCDFLFKTSNCLTFFISQVKVSKINDQSGCSTMQCIYTPLQNQSIFTPNLIPECINKMSRPHYAMEPLHTKTSSYATGVYRFPSLRMRHAIIRGRACAQKDLDPRDQRLIVKQFEPRPLINSARANLGWKCHPCS